MRIAITGRHMDVTGALKDHIEGSLEKVRSHFDRVIDADVVLSVEKHRHIAEITLNANGIRIHGKEESEDMYASVDNVVNKLEKQVRKFKGRLNHYQPRETKEDRAFQYNVIAVSADDEAEAPANGHTVVLREQLTMKPMSVEEATMQLELADEEFLVFSNAETQKVNVLYSREDGTFGLIEPQF